jgi:polyhydroxybutyrate depolymerase
LPDIVADHATAVRYTYLPQDVATGGEARQRSDAEVILVKIEGGGHTWPGRTAPIKMLGPSTADVIANDVIWEFFRRHPMPLGR